MMEKVLVTGGAGFIGSNFLLYMVPRYPGSIFINLDKLTYAANLNNLKKVNNCANYSFIKGDISLPDTVKSVVREGVNCIINFAAESHVDKSIKNPNSFVLSNITGCFNLLEAAKNYGVKKFLQISTDEVYGSIEGEGLFTEPSPLAPNNPYSASKAAADCVARAYFKTYGLNINITRSANNYGPFQHGEKFIPTVIYRALHDEPIPIYGDGRQIRDWLFVEDHCRALETVLLKGRPGRIYNISSGEEKRNLELAGSILHILKKSSSLLSFVKDRPCHDRRYAMSSERIQKELGWKPRHDLEVSLKKTVNWYVQQIENGSLKE